MSSHESESIVCRHVYIVDRILGSCNQLAGCPKPEAAKL
jgi:hypothetical protein